MNSNKFARQISSPNTGVKPVLEGTEEYHEKPQSGKSITRTRFEPGTSRIYCKAEVPIPRHARLYCVVCGHVCKFYIVYNKINQFRRLGETLTEIFTHHRLWPFVRKGWTSLLYSGTGNVSQSGLLQKNGTILIHMDNASYLMTKELSSHTTITASLLPPGMG
jgi:hypothetical protein